MIFEDMIYMIFKCFILPIFLHSKITFIHNYLGWSRKCYRSTMIHTRNFVAADSTKNSNFFFSWGVGQNDYNIT